ncbi:MAG: ATP synthase F1 subunit gamma [Proteobacteria bacterium]|nr:ATP synthase F1 subunit gamma [Pseudomonadota bacterium]
MPSLRHIRRRIQSVKSTQKITKAMKMVSAAKLKRAQDAILTARAYAEKLQEVISELAARVETKTHPLLQDREEKKSLLMVVLTSDRGLCGVFNSNLLRQTEAYIREKRQSYGDNISIITVGRKGTEYLRKRNYNVIESLVNVYQKEQYETAREIGEKIIESFISGNADEVVVVYNRFKSAISQVPTFTRLLPVEPIEIPENVPKTEFIYEPDKETLINELLPRNVYIQIHRSILETIASELAARMTAMDNATNNASDMIERLTLLFNKTRQASITKELMEIIGGAEAIKK